MKVTTRVAGGFRSIPVQINFDVSFCNPCVKNKSDLLHARVKNMDSPNKKNFYTFPVKDVETVEWGPVVGLPTRAHWKVNRINLL